MFHAAAAVLGLAPGVLALGLRRSSWFCPLGVLSPGLLLSWLVSLARSRFQLLPACELRSKNSSFACYHPLTVACEAKVGGLGGLLTKFSFRRAGSRLLKPESMNLWPLGARGQVPQLLPAVKTDILKFQPAPKVTIRINAPEHYRRFFVETDKSDSPAAIFTELAGLQVAPATAFCGGDWKREKTARINQLVGHIRVSPELAAKLIPFSGCRGVFITQTKVSARDETISWFDVQENENMDEYLIRCLKAAGHRRLRFRSGGGKDLG